MPSPSRGWPVLLRLFLGSLALATFSCGDAGGQETWPEFRGPTADGVAALTSLPDRIDETVIVWKTPIKGKGWSSPVVWDDQIWMTTATKDGKQMFAVCVSLATGELLYNVQLLENETPDSCHSMNSYATPTPVVTADHVFLHFGTYGTFCLDRKTGETLWSRTDLKCDHHRGPASSPILFDGKLFVAFDGSDQQYVVALNANNGKDVWKVDRDIKYGTNVGDYKKAYGTARIVTVDGQPLLVCPAAVATIAYRPADGTAVWTVYHQGMNVAARPLVTANGLVVIANGMGLMIGVKPNGQGDVTETHVAWRLRKSVPHKSSQVISDSLLFMADEQGVLSCLDPETGDIVWRERVGGSFAASPIAAEGKIYFFDMKQNIHVIRSGRKFELVSKTQLDDGFMASPAVVGNSLILRSRSHLFRIGKHESD